MPTRISRLISEGNDGHGVEVEGQSFIADVVEVNGNRKCGFVARDATIISVGLLIARGNGRTGAYFGPSKAPLNLEEDARAEDVKRAITTQTCALNLASKGR